MSGLPGIEEIRSISQFGLSAVTVVFEEGTDIYFARQLVTERLTEAREAIPQGLGEPEMGPISTGLGEIYQFEVKGEGHVADGAAHDPRLGHRLTAEVRARRRRGQRLRRRAQDLPGPARRLQQLVAYDLAIGEVFEALERQQRQRRRRLHRSTRGEQYLIRGEGLVHSLEDIGNIVVASRRTTGTPIYVRDLGRVAFAPMIRQGAVTRDGRGEAVIGHRHDADGRELARGREPRQGEDRARSGRSLPAGRDDRHLLRPHGARAQDDPHRRQEPDRGRRCSSSSCCCSLLGNLRGGPDRRLGDPALDARRLHRHGRCRHLRQPDEPRRDRLRPDRRRLGGHDREHRPPHRASGGAGQRRAPISDRADDRDRSRRRPRGRAARSSSPSASSSSSTCRSWRSQDVEGKMFRPMALTVVFALAGSLLLRLTLIPVLASFVPAQRRERGRDVADPSRGTRCTSRSSARAMRRRVIGVGSAVVVFAGERRRRAVPGRGVHPAPRRGRDRRAGLAAAERLARGVDTCQPR